ncbi:MAG: flagellar motor switch protein FliN [Rhodospirillaceae bacterium]|jgi:flagellar motor switch protein FliN|nr:flagellar motor switch protein FliN [Rhodospirillaceae bacterium]MBT5375063.1 flagellar motor switch protein FliN [Rhodospirillaceae bacterium]MBT5752750.1 flagellar motor switch protein FliN [Rhodospirillaceae bacterium]
MSDQETTNPTEEATPPAEEAAPNDLQLAEFDDPPPPPESPAQDPMAINDIMDEDISQKDLDAVYDIPVQVSAVLGKAEMQVSQLLKLGRGAVVELDRKVGEAIDIYVNNRLVARGEVVVVDERLGVTMTEIIKSDQS